jgi:hypothetical protein
MTRNVYRLILRLHPAPFRDRFATEMLWIFDAERQRPALLLDGVVSLLRQHAKARPAPRPVLAGFGLLDSGAGITPRRLFEATAMATLLLGAILLLLNHPPRFMALPSCPPGAPRPTTRPLVAPTRIQPLNGVLHSQPKNGSVQTGPEQVNDGVAGALRVLRASSSVASTPFCTPTQTN